MGIEIRRNREQKNMCRLTKFSQRVILVINLQFRWWANSEISVSEKAKYTMSLLTKTPFGKGVDLYGHPFQSDNQLALLLLPDYVGLVQPVRDLIRRTPTSDNHFYVLDIGGNVGQFATAAIRFMGATVVSYEPNPTCWSFLAPNSSEYKNWTYIKRAVSEHELQMELHFVEGKSAQGSFSKVNSTTNLLSSEKRRSVLVESGPIRIEDLRNAGCEVSHFDLVKIDVEGYELEALKGLGGVTFDFLFVEIAEDRDHGFCSADVVDTAYRTLGIQIEEIYSDKPASGAEPRNVLFKKL